MSSNAKQEELLRKARARHQHGELFEAVKLLLEVAEMGGDLGAEARAAFLQIIDELEAKLRASPKRDLDAKARTISLQIIGKLEARLSALPGGDLRAALRKQQIRLQEYFAPPPLPPFSGAVVDTVGKHDQQEPAVAKGPVRRTPHIDLEPEVPLQPGTSVEVRVYVDKQAAKAGETSEEVIVKSGAHAEVHLLVSEHFSIEGKTIQPIVIKGEDERSDAEPFRLRVKSADELPPDVPAGITALFFYEGRPSGKVSRAVEITGVVAAKQPSSASARIELLEAKAANLSVTVVAAPANDGRQFFCTVRTQLLDGYKNGISEAWNLKDVTEKLVHAYMGKFTGKSTPKKLIAELRGAGIQFFDAAPKVFRTAFWDLIDSGKQLTDIAIVSEEPYIPWELMVPCRKKDGGIETRQPLGVEFRVGRWIPGDVIAPPQTVPLHDSYVIAPRYEGKMLLSFSGQEQKLVLEMFPGNLIDPAKFEKIEEQLRSEGRSLVHFVCHGKDDPSGLQTIFLEGNEELDSSTILGMDGLEKTFARKRPFVFLNACEVGRTTPALVGVGGFAKSFIDLGASVVIAPLWSVKDKIAHEIAESFYTTAKAEPEMPFAEILRRIRAKAYASETAEDTYAAYCFYGDPAATRS